MAYVTSFTVEKISGLGRDGFSLSRVFALDGMAQNVALEQTAFQITFPATSSSKTGLRTSLRSPQFGSAVRLGELMSKPR